jgi:hypothetical protein
MHSTFIQQNIDRRTEMYKARKEMIGKNREAMKDRSKFKAVADNLKKLANVKAEEIFK